MSEPESPAKKTRVRRVKKERTESGKKTKRTRVRKVRKEGKSKEKSKTKGKERGKGKAEEEPETAKKKKRQYKFTVSLLVDSLIDVPLTNATLLTTWKVTGGGRGLSGHTQALRIARFQVKYAEAFTFTTTLTSRTASEPLSSQLLRLTVFQELKGGQKRKKLGFVDVDLAHAVGWPGVLRAGRPPLRRFLLQDCTSNSALALGLVFAQVSGGPDFVPRPLDGATPDAPAPHHPDAAAAAPPAAAAPTLADSMELAQSHATGTLRLARKSGTVPLLSTDRIVLSDQTSAVLGLPTLDPATIAANMAIVNAMFEHVGILAPSPPATATPTPTPAPPHTHTPASPRRTRNPLRPPLRAPVWAPSPPTPSSPSVDPDLADLSASELDLFNDSQ